MGRKDLEAAKKNVEQTDGTLVYSLGLRHTSLRELLIHRPDKDIKQ